MGEKISDYHYIYRGKEALLIAGVMLLWFVIGVWTGYCLSGGG